MMDANEGIVAPNQMQAASDAFCRSAISIRNNPFIEFAGLMNEYINEKLECIFSGSKLLEATEAVLARWSRARNATEL